MKPKKKQYEDDGRVIANMDVEGMRRREKPSIPDRLPSNQPVQGEQMTRSQARQYTWYSMLAALLISAVFSVTWILFVLFCIYVWFR